MEKLPFFKFFPTEWVSGEITLLEYHLQGIFINLCAHYWITGGQLNLRYLKSRLPGITKDDLQTLVNEGIMSIDGQSVHISFLARQIEIRVRNAPKNRINGKKGGRPLKPKQNPNNNPLLTQTEPTRKGISYLISSVPTEGRGTDGEGVVKTVPIPATPTPLGAWLAEKYKLKYTGDQLERINAVGEQIKKRKKEEREQFREMVTKPSKIMLNEFRESPAEFLEICFDQLDVEYDCYINQKKEDYQADHPEGQPEELP